MFCGSFVEWCRLLAQVRRGGHISAAKHSREMGHSKGEG